MNLTQTLEDESELNLKRGEDVLRENADRYRTLFDLAPGQLELGFIWLSEVGAARAYNYLLRLSVS